MSRFSSVALAAGLCTGLLCAATISSAVAADPAVLAEQSRRIETVERVAPSVVAIFGKDGNGGGSGVLISADGYVLTNFHVTSGAGTFMKCGLNDGVLYDGVIVGIDPTGDVAMVKLVGRDDFPFAPLGDSDKLQAGDWAFAMGNPFLLATDFTPTVTYGIVSGVHRYQYPAGQNLLEYTDCIQIDTSINPGNSGGPLFNDAGELVGINGRGSFEKRGRVNSGAGYAISINQIKHFMDHLRSGRIVDHATLGAVVATDPNGRVIVSNILEESEAHRRGLRMDDEIVSFAGRNIGSVNQFKNILGIYPAGWKLPLVYRREDVKTEIFPRLRTVHTQKEMAAMLDPKPSPQAPRPGRRPGPRPEKPTPDKPAPDGEKPEQPAPIEAPKPMAEEPVPANLAPFFIKKEGYVNFRFNQLEQQRTLAGLTRLGDFAGFTGTWKIAGKVDGKTPFEFRLGEADKGLGLIHGENNYFQEMKDLAEIKDEPAGTGGLLVAMHHLRLLLSSGPKYFTTFYYLGSEPLDGQGEQVDVLVGELSVAKSYFYFSKTDGRFIGFRFERDFDAEPCDIRIEEFAELQGVQFPKRLRIRHADKDAGVFEIESFIATGEKKPAAPAP